MKIRLQWENKTGKYQYGEWLRAGKVIVGSVDYYGYASKGDPNRYVCEIKLPGIKQAECGYETIDEAKCRLEALVLTWFKWFAVDAVTGN